MSNFIPEVVPYEAVDIIIAAAGVVLFLVVLVYVINQDEEIV